MSVAIEVDVATADDQMPEAVLSATTLLEISPFINTVAPDTCKPGWYSMPDAAVLAKVVFA